MRIGLVGYGAWGRVHAAVIARIPELSLAAVVCGSAGLGPLPRRPICPASRSSLELEALLPTRPSI